MLTALIAVGVVAALAYTAPAYAGPAAATPPNLPTGPSELQSGQFLTGLLASPADGATPAGTYSASFDTSTDSLEVHENFGGDEPSALIYSTFTQRSGGSQLVLQGDGNLVIYTAAMRAVWSNNVFPGAGAFLAMQSDGNLVEYSRTGAAVWSTDTWLRPPPPPTPSDGDTILEGQTLTPGSTLISADNAYTLAMQGDGNLVVYGSCHGAIWSTRTYGHPGAYLAMQTDSNAVVYSAQTGGPLWDSATFGYGVPRLYRTRLVVQNDGNLVMYTQFNKAIWSSGADPRKPCPGVTVVPVSPAL